MPKTLIVTSIILIVLVGGYLVAQRGFVQKTTLLTSKLTIAMVETPPPTLALIYIAENKGYFKEEGLEIAYKTFLRGIDCIEDALRGGSDIALTYETPVVRKIYEGEKLRIISTLHTSTKDTALVARKDKGILITDDLKGKKIGVTKNSSFEFFLHSHLLSQGIRLSDVTFVDGEFTNMATMLKSGEVDAVAVGNPYLYDVKKEFPQGSLSTFQSEVYTENSIVSGREDTIIDKKEALTKFVRALVKAEEFYKANNQEALNAVIVELTTSSEENIRATWDQFTPSLKLDNVLLTLLNREGQWFKDNGIYETETLDFRSAIFTDYLKSVKPEAVTVF